MKRNPNNTNLGLSVTLTPEDVKHLEFLGEYYLKTRGVTYSKAGIIKAALGDLYIRESRD